NYISLQVFLVDVYREICNTGKIPSFRPIKNKRGGRNRIKYYEYYRIYGYFINECFDLKNVIEKLVREGRLDRYLVSKTDEFRKRRRDEEVGRTE
ncbi:hypothetical protein DF186_14390, partial [Enterococcus hirae]